MATPKRPQPKAKPRERNGALYAEVGEDVLDQIGAWLDKLNGAPSGPKWSRQDLVRAVLLRACAERGEKGEAP